MMNVHIFYLWVVTLKSQKKKYVTVDKLHTSLVYCTTIIFTSSVMDNFFQIFLVYNFSVVNNYY